MSEPVLLSRLRATFRGDDRLIDVVEGLRLARVGHVPNSSLKEYSSLVEQYITIPNVPAGRGPSYIPSLLRSERLPELLVELVDDPAEWGLEREFGVLVGFEEMFPLFSRVLVCHAL